MADNISDADAPYAPKTIAPETTAFVPKKKVRVWIKEAVNVRCAFPEGERVLILRQGENLVDEEFVNNSAWNFVKRLIVDPPAGPGAPLSATRAQDLAAANPLMTTQSANDQLMRERREQDIALHKTQFEDSAAHRAAKAQESELAGRTQLSQASLGADRALFGREAPAGVNDATTGDKITAATKDAKGEVEAKRKEEDAKAAEDAKGEVEAKAAEDAKAADVKSAKAGKNSGKSTAEKLADASKG